jgi:RimJ/RimL family protein N-acetyltransferase
VKSATIRWAHRQGIREIVTSNDSTNAPMLALNDDLGYRLLYYEREFTRILRTAAE